MMELGKGGQSKRPRLRFVIKKSRLNNGKRQQSSSPSESEAVAAAAAAAAGFKFMSVVSDDVLQEILVRLPDSRSVIQCGPVCKRWLSLVSRRSQSGLYFICKFNRHHRLKRLQQQQKLPYTLLIKGLDCSTLGSGLRPRPDIYRPGSPSYHLLSDKSKILDHGNVSTSTTLDGKVEDEQSYLDFLSWPRHLGCIISSFDDLLLLRVSNYMQFIICNPLTKQWILVPNIPFNLTSNYNIFHHRFGFVCKPNCNCNSQFRQVGGGMSFSSSCYCNCSIKYRVAYFVTCSSSSQVFSVAVFSSETGQWRKSKLRFPYNLCSWHETSVGNNGIIYCRVGDTMLKGIVAFDPFKDDSEEEEEQQQQRCRLISLPSEFSQGPVSGHSAKARLGVVRGRLRLVQFYFIKTSNTYALKAWELDDGDHNNASWHMVHHVLFRRKDKSVVLFPVALHPEDGDVVFLTCSANGGIRFNDIFQYKIERFNDIFQYKIESGDDVELVFRCRGGSGVFPLVHPLWPTTIPSLPSSPYFMF